MPPNTSRYAPGTRQAVKALRVQPDGPEVDPAVVDAAHVLSAPLAATVRAGGIDEHARHWPRNSPDLPRPKRRRAILKIITDAFTRAGATSCA